MYFMHLFEKTHLTRRTDRIPFFFFFTEQPEPACHGFEAHFQSSGEYTLCFIPFFLVQQQFQHFNKKFFAYVGSKIPGSLFALEFARFSDRKHPLDGEKTHFRSRSSSATFLFDPRVNEPPRKVLFFFFGLFGVSSSLPFFG